MNKTSSLKVLTLLCIVFIASSALNDGFSRFVCGIPFYAGLFYCAHKLKLNNKLKIVAGSYIIGSILFNLTLTHNPFIYPIIGGKITFLEDGFITQYSDNSAGFSTAPMHIECAGCGQQTIHTIKKGDQLEVQGIKATHPDLSTKLTLITNKGNLSLPESHLVQYSKTLSSPVLKLNVLMYYPVIPIMTFTYISSFKSKINL